MHNQKQVLLRGLQVNSSNGKWCVARVEVNGTSTQSEPEQPLLEFVVHNGAGVYDKPQTGIAPSPMQCAMYWHVESVQLSQLAQLAPTLMPRRPTHCTYGCQDQQIFAAVTGWEEQLVWLCAGGNYEITETGMFALNQGTLQKSSGEAVLLVSDLDDTMIGDDAATAEFRDYWESEALTRGSLLVYNTGRAVDKFQELCQQKQHCLAMPDVLMSSVGTKVYNWQNGSWAEDAQYASRLDHAWKLETVREATYATLAAAGREKMHFRPPEEQNDHKVTCGVHVDVIDQVQQQISESLEADGVEARLILSGKGDWRFLDIVSINAGKLQALEFVRQKYGFAHNRTIACGDSGNDKDMLSGQNLAIVVGNAQPDLLKWVNDTQVGSGSADVRLLITKEHMARGILQGLQTFGLK